MKISKYFTKEEIACKCGCGFAEMNPATLAIADKAREFVGYSITPSSGCRCEKHNSKVGGEKNSYHVKGMAMDLPVKNPEHLYEYLCKEYPDSCGFGLYDTFVHVDCRTKKARWSK